MQSVPNKNDSAANKYPTVLIIGRGIPSSRYPLRGIFEFDQAKALSNTGCKVLYAAIDVRSARHPRPWGLRTFNQDGVRVYSYNFPAGKIGIRLKKILIGRLLRVVFKKILAEKHHPDLVHAHFPEMGYGSLSFVRKEKLPFIYTEHFSRLVSGYVPRSLKRAVDHIDQVADQVIAVSPSLQEQLKSRYGVSSVVIPNIIDISLFSNRPEEKRENAPFTFISVGSLIPVKNMDMLITSFHRAFYMDDQGTSDQQPRLHIVGNGPQYGKLEKMIKELQLEQHIMLHGELDRQDIAGLFQESDCFVLLSKTETFGVSYIEAMASGLPVIASRCGGPESFVTHENGLLVDVDDIAGSVDAMRKMTLLRSMVESKENISFETSLKFSPEHISKQIFDIYRKSLSEDHT